MRTTFCNIFAHWGWLRTIPVQLLRYETGGRGAPIYCRRGRNTGHPHVRLLLIENGSIGTIFCNIFSHFILMVRQNIAEAETPDTRTRGLFATKTGQWMSACTMLFNILNIHFTDSHVNTTIVVCPCMKLNTGNIVFLQIWTRKGKGGKE